MKKYIVAICLAMGACIASAEQVTLSGHQLNVKDLECRRGFCTGFFNDDNGFKWAVLAKQNNSAFFNLIRFDQFKATRAWIMTVEPKSSKKEIKSNLIGVDVDCSSFTARIVHVSVYDTFFCKGKSKQRSEEIRDPFVPTPGSPVEVASGLVCTRLKQNGS